MLLDPFLKYVDQDNYVVNLFRDIFMCIVCHDILVIRYIVYYEIDHLAEARGNILFTEHCGSIFLDIIMVFF